MAPYDAEYEQLLQRKKYADRLRNPQPLQGQMVGRVYVAPSYGEGLANVLQSYLGNKADVSVTKDLQSWAANKRAQSAEEVSSFLNSLNGKNQNMGQTDVQIENQADPNMQRNKMLAQALSSSNPILQQYGNALLSSQLPKERKWQKVELPSADGSQKVGFVDLQAANPIETFVQGGVSPVKNEFVNGTPVNPYDPSKRGVPIPQQANPFNDLLISGENGALIPNNPLIKAKAQIAAAGKPQTTVINKIENKAAESIAREAGEVLKQSSISVESAFQLKDTANQILAAIKNRNAIIGPYANQRLSLAQMADTLGIGGRNNEEKLQNTRELMMGLARLGAEARLLGKGQGAMTEGESRLYQRVLTGEIDNLSIPEIKTIANGANKVANIKIMNHNKKLEVVNELPGTQGIAKLFDPVNIPQENNPPSVSNW